MKRFLLVGLLMAGGCSNKSVLEPLPPNPSLSASFLKRGGVGQWQGKGSLKTEVFRILNRGSVTWSGQSTVAPSASTVGIEIYRADNTLIKSQSMQVLMPDAKTYVFDKNVTGDFYIKITGNSSYYVEAVDSK